MSTAPGEAGRRRSVAAPGFSASRGTDRKSPPRQSKSTAHAALSTLRTGTERGIGREPPAAKLRSREGLIRLRISGLGHQFEMDATATATLGDLKEEIERKTGIPSPYQKLVARRKKLDDDTMVLGQTVMDQKTIVSMGIGFEDRTKILLLHSPLYEQDTDGIGKLTTLVKEIDRVDTGRRSRNMDNKIVQELIIQVCCKIDAVETNGSDALRKMRKMTVKKAEDVARESEENKRGVDP